MTRHLIDTIRKAQQGQQQSMHDLYCLFSQQVRALAFDRTGDYSAACDIVQEVFLAMMQGLKRLKEPEHLNAWLSGITRRKAADFVRSRVEERKRFQDLQDDWADKAEKPHPREMLDQLRQAVEGLPEEERLAVQLFHLEALPVSRITEITHLPRSTIYVRLIKARTRIREQLEKLGYSEEPS
ncbi:MAG: RNA polymerase sigma factor [Planctomycetota bacterium]